MTGVTVVDAVPCPGCGSVELVPPVPIGEFYDAEVFLLPEHDAGPKHPCPSCACERVHCPGSGSALGENATVRVRMLP